MKGFPTSADIYLELDGRKIAVVQSYRAKAAKSSKMWRPSARASRWPPLKDRKATPWS